MTNHYEPDPLFEYGWHCGLCDYGQSWTTELAANVAAAQHVRDWHPDAWREVGESYVDNPAWLAEPPEAFGRRFEGWESQL